LLQKVVLKLYSPFVAREARGRAFQLRYEFLLPQIALLVSLI
jgi:hypothetical protein